ncbi:hypothetical protein PI124_g19114 [Phytophthora idaei]|nr:hypothetical protein PI125_g13322 [Phytophthora idaei]KAG3150698.1 hypothetical protein PI126_g11366 [Phytophthora idaei]KAG3235863.1 hypothetical protein PI124_g19114 [Phytophthora idaei]
MTFARHAGLLELPLHPDGLGSKPHAGKLASYVAMHREPLEPPLTGTQASGMPVVLADQAVEPSGPFEASAAPVAASIASAVAKPDAIEEEPVSREPIPENPECGSAAPSVVADETNTETNVDNGVDAFDNDHFMDVRRDFVWSCIAG